ncbi:hypothetical protein GCM10009779_27010 [Polymorphospora rubra]|uniref:Uncharacterized protein n=1 Tax=Polymorphospora rubra TaxID=338584 RepID=A0A810N4U7_9ACTN|nr:hypothetical protein Prubr_37890 [Polymorphospora rubra]
MPWISSTGVPSAGPATCTCWVIPRASTRTVSVSMRRIIAPGRAGHHVGRPHTNRSGAVAVGPVPTGPVSIGPVGGARSAQRVTISTQATHPASITSPPTTRTSRPDRRAVCIA